MSPKIHAEFWTDPDLEERPPQMKLTLLWMLTNPYISLCGVFELSPKRFQFETGLATTWLEETLRDLGKMFAVAGNKVLILNFIRHQYGHGPALRLNNMGKAVMKELPKLPEVFREAIYDRHPELKPLPSPYQALPSTHKSLTNGGDGEFAFAGLPPDSGSESEALPKDSQAQRIGIGIGEGIRTGGDSKGEDFEPCGPGAEFGTDAGAVKLPWKLAAGVLEFLNKKIGATFPGHQAVLLEIAMRLHEVRNDVAGVQQMIERQVALWNGDARTRQWLRPSTLFKADKFHEYYGARAVPFQDLKNGGAGEVKQRRQWLQEQIEKSPANRESVYHNPNCGEVDKAQLKKLRAELAELNRSLAAERRAE